MKTESTPLPWAYQEGSDVYTHIIRGANNEFVIQGSQDTSGRVEKDIRFIVHAVNCHAELIAALEEINNNYSYSNKRVSDKAIDMVGAAINKAKGL